MLLFKLQTHWLQWKAWVWTTHLFLPTNMKLAFYRLFSPQLQQLICFLSAHTVWVGAKQQHRKRGMRQRQRERERWKLYSGKGSRWDVLPHPASLSGNVTSQTEFITTAVHTSARHCLHIKAVIVVKYLFPSSKRNKNMYNRGRWISKTCITDSVTKAKYCTAFT